MKRNINILKIGSSIINDANSLDLFLSQFARLSEPKILVHGGGRIATELCGQLGITTKMINGRRITSTENLSVVTMVYAGLINKNICAKLQSYNCNAIGLSGVDANSILSAKRDVNPIDYGWVGDIAEVSVNIIQLFLANNMAPVFCAIGHDGKGQLLNTNADTIAAEIAIAMSHDFESRLIYCCDKKGVLADTNNDDSVIESISWAKYQGLKEKGIIDEGMMPKMENSFHALENNVSKVIIGNINVIDAENKLYTSITL